MNRQDLVNITDFLQVSEDDFYKDALREILASEDQYADLNKLFIALDEIDTEIDDFIINKANFDIAELLGKVRSAKRDWRNDFFGSLQESNKVLETKEPEQKEQVNESTV